MTLLWISWWTGSSWAERGLFLAHWTWKRTFGGLSMVCKCQGLSLFRLINLCAFQMNLFRVGFLHDRSSDQLIFIQSLAFCKQVHAIHVIMFKLVDLQMGTKSIILTWILSYGMDLCTTSKWRAIQEEKVTLATLPVTLDKKHWSNSGIGLSASPVSHHSIKISPCIDTAVYLWTILISKSKINNWELGTKCPLLSQ